MKQPIPDNTAKVLSLISGGICSLCQKALVEISKDGEISYIGKSAHIKGEKPGSARYDETLTPKEKVVYTNLLPVCGTCHDKIDHNPTDYSEEYLQNIKNNQTIKFIAELKVATLNISFVELEVILRYLADQPVVDQEYSYDILPIKEKIKKNSLNIEVEKCIDIGLLQLSQVKDYINRHPDLHFGEKLRQQFVKTYVTLKEEGKDPNEIFMNILASSTSVRSSQMNYVAATLAVITYFFEICEIFEK